MMVARPFDFIPVAEPDLTVIEEAELIKAIRSGWISSIGEYINRFENEFASFCGARHGVAVSNGTVAIHLALLVANVQNEDEVILPSLTFAATAAAVRHAGAIPVFVDCEEMTGNLDPAAVRQAISSRTKAVIAVHLYGHPAEMDALRELCQERGLVLIEDAAEAHGALYRGRPVGGIGDLATFSFYGNKILTTGEGGMVLTSDPNFNARLRFLRDHAMDPTRRYWHTEIGYNYRITNLQASLGVAQLMRYEDIAGKRRQLLSWYRQSGIEGKYGILFNPHHNWVDPAIWMITLVLSDGFITKRDLLCKSLYGLGIDSRKYFSPLHHMPPYQAFSTTNAEGGEKLYVTERLSKLGMNLPSSPNLTEQQVGRITDALDRILSRTVSQ